MGVSKTFNEQTLHNDPDSLPAVGLDFDGQMVMEVLKPGVEFVEDENNAYRLLVATRIGHDAIRARAFRVSADLRTLYSPGFVEYVKRDLISKIPDEIPIA